MLWDELPHRVVAVVESAKKESNWRVRGVSYAEKFINYLEHMRLQQHFAKLSCESSSFCHKGKFAKHTVNNFQWTFFAVQTFENEQQNTRKESNLERLCGVVWGSEWVEVAEGGPGFNYFSKEKHEKSATTLSIMFSSLRSFSWKIERK